MNTRYFMAVLLGLAVMASSQAHDKPAKEEAPADKAVAASTERLTMTRTQCDVYSNVQQCCGAKKCGGNVLSNRDAHNCGRTSGKSWHPAAQNGQPAACTNL